MLWFFPTWIYYQGRGKIRSEYKNLSLSLPLCEVNIKYKGGHLIDMEGSSSEEWNLNHIARK